MKTLHTLVVAATLVAGMSAAQANPFNAMGDLSTLDDVSTAHYATVVQVNDNEAFYLKFENDVSSIQARIKGNPALLKTVADQGYTIDQVVGIDGNVTNLTIYAL